MRLRAHTSSIDDLKDDLFLKIRKLCLMYVLVEFDLINDNFFSSIFSCFTCNVRVLLCIPV